MNHRKNNAISAEIASGEGVRQKSQTERANRGIGINMRSKLHKSSNRSNVLRGKKTLHFTFHLRSWKNSRK